jgi:hypothetical protein
MKELPMSEIISLAAWRAGHRPVGTINLYTSADGHIGVDACVPRAVGVAMMAVAAHIQFVGLMSSRVGPNLSIKVELDPDDVVAFLAPAARAGVRIDGWEDVEPWTANRRAAHGYEPTREAAMAAFAKSWRRE